MGTVSEPNPPLNVRGAVDLGALAAQREAQQRAADAPAGVVVDVTEATFQADVLERSLTVPVVLDLWATWCQPCKQLSPVLEALAAEYGGRFVLAKIDVDANPRISQAFQVQSIPSVFAVVQGQPIPLFQGALPEPQVRQYLDALLAEAAKAGVTGTAGAAEPADGDVPPEPPSDPDADAAYAAMETGDWAAAEAAFERLVARQPGDEAARAGLAAARLYGRIGEADPVQAVAAADAAPTDVPAQILAADVAAANGDVEGAFTRLIDTVRRTSDEDRAAAREHLVELFDVIGAGDPRVTKARAALANALF
ncbi:MAG: tetratricopeptide repeat protein [Candidatus Nanopelagicales bacterium]